MNTQPVALRLADELESYVGRPVCTEAAAELRRLFEHAHAQHSEIYGLRLQVRNLKALNQELLKALQKLSIFTQEVHNHWDNDRDMKVGKCLLALSGLLPGYDKRVDEIHAAIAKAQGEQA